MALAEVLFTRAEIQARVRELAVELQSALGRERPLLVSVLKGSVVFLADLVRNLEVDPDIDFMSITSYGEGRSESGVVRIVKDLDEPLEGRDVVVVEDIVDTGLSLAYLLRALQTRGPASLRVCALVQKQMQRIVDVDVQHVGFEVDRFVIGYGLDFQGRYRNLPDLVAVADLASLAARPWLLTGLYRPIRAAREASERPDLGS